MALNEVAALSALEVQKLLADADALAIFVDRVTGRDSPESQDLATLALEMSAGNTQIGTECEQLRGRVQELQREIEAIRIRLQESRNNHTQLSSLISTQRTRLSAPAPMRTELSRRAEALEEESESLANAFVEGQDSSGQQQNGAPLALEEWLRRYSQLRVSLHLAHRALSQQPL
jgi:chromosome segregation ATPase